MAETNSVRISSFTITNYRSCQNTVVRLNPQLSALVGVNGSGKTNVLKALLLLRKLLNFRPYHKPQDKSATSCRLGVDFQVGDKLVGYTATINYTTNERNSEELLSTEEQWDFKDTTGSEGRLSLPMSVLRARGTERQWLLAEYFAFRRAVTTNLHSEEGLNVSLQPEKGIQFKLHPDLSEPTLNLLDQISLFVSKINYYSASQYTNPSECPAYFELEENDVLRRSYGPNNHVRFLFDLYMFKQKHRQAYDDYESIVGKEGLGLVDKIDFHPVPVPSSEIEIRTGGKIVKKMVKRVLVVPHFVIHGTKLSPSQLSEGTFKTLAVLLYLSADASELVLLEEPEVCIHHGLLSSLVELIKTYAMQKQIIVSTHSDFVLDQLAPENVFLVQNMPRKGTVVEHLPESMSATGYKALKEYLGTTGNLGEYWRHAGFDDG